MLVSSALALTMGLTSLAPGQAAPVLSAPAQIDTAGVSQATEIRDLRQRRGFHRREGRAFYNGHRGYREQRRGYRRHNGYWFPPAAFILGAIIGNQLNNGYVVERRGGLSNAHYRWCDAKYRSYRTSDNTFQPYNGGRKQCVSPYY